MHIESARVCRDDKRMCPRSLGSLCVTLWGCDKQPGAAIVGNPAPCQTLAYTSLVNNPSTIKYRSGNERAGLYNRPGVVVQVQLYDKTSTDSQFCHSQ